MTVFVCQRHKVLDKVTRTLVDKYDLTDARRYGALVYMLDHDSDVRETQPIVDRLRNCLSQFKETDYLLMIGNPLIIGLAVALASDYSPSGFVRCLQWTPSERRYQPLSFNLYPEAANVTA